METKKYKLLENDTIEVGERTLYRIEALRDFDNVKKGDKGGYVQSEKNLSHEGTCWVSADAKVYDNARVYDDGKVCGCAVVCGNVEVCGDATIHGTVRVWGEVLMRQGL